jgi:hypothetical protein
MNMNEKIINCLILSTFLITSCSKSNYTAGNEVSLSEKAVQEQGVIEEPKVYSLWKDLVHESKANLAFAELLAKSVQNQSRDYVQGNVKMPTQDELEEIVRKVEKDSDKSRRDYLFYDSNLKNDDAVMKTLLADQVEMTGSVFSEEKQFIIKSFSKIKTDLLNSIFSLYDQKMSENSKVLAEFGLKEISEKRPDLKIRIEASVQVNELGLKDLIRNTLKEMKSFDDLFKNSNLSLEDQIVVTTMELVADQAYKLMKDKKSFQEILKTYKEVQDLSIKVREVVALSSGIDSYQNEMKKDWCEFNNSIKGMYNDSSDLLSKSTSYEFKADERKIQGFLYDTFLGTKNKKTGGVNPSILSKEISLNQNFANAVQKVEKMNGNFNLILDNTDKMAKLFKIDLPPGFKKISDTAKKASAMVRTLNMAINGLQSGGVIGGLNAITSGPIMSLMGLSTDPDAEFRGEVLTQLGVLDQKLDQVVSLQLETMKTQIDTMSMIKNLALMVDAYHWQEMDMLSDLRDLQLVNVEMEKLNLNQKLRSCERLFHYQLNAKRLLNPYRSSPYDNIKIFDADIQMIRNNMNSFENIAKMIESTEPSGWDNCLLGINEAFGGQQLSENPIRLIYSSNENENYLKFNKYQYQPLVKFLNSTKKKNVYFHLPVISFSSLDRKYDYMKNYQDQGATDILNEPISTHSLQRYTTQLLAFYPFVNINKEVWKEGLERVLQVEIDQAKSLDDSRGYYLLKNNLIFIQSAIAQEALLSGELVFDELLRDREGGLRNNVTNADGLSYAVATNKMLVMNLLRYSLIGQDSEAKKGIFLKTYARVYEARDLSGISKFFSNNTIAQNITLDKNQRIALRLIVDKNEVIYPLPTPEELEEGKILYSQNMYQLQELERRVIEAMIKISPKNYSSSQKEILERMMILL